MWEPKLESSSSSGTAAATTNSSSSPNSQSLLHAEDSGLIDSGFLSSEHILQSYSTEEDKHNNDTPVAAAEPNHHQHHHNGEEGGIGKQQQQFDSYLDSGLVEDAEFESGTGVDQEMLLERDLDNGLAEWQCTLDMKSNVSGSGAVATTAQSSAANHQMINNLSRRVDMATASLDQMNISDAPVKANNKQQQQKAVEVEMPEEEQPWEICYKQDAEGDT